MALDLSPRDEDIIYNLDIAKSKIANLIEPPDFLIIDSLNMIQLLKHCQIKWQH